MKLKQLWFIMLAFFCVGCQVQTSTPIQNQEQVTLKRVVDGDTVIFNIDGKETKVRVLLVDTPESVKPDTPIYPFGKEASERTKELLKKAKIISLEYEETGKKEDKYDRALAYVFVDGKLLEEILVEEGLARVAFYKGQEKYLSLLKTKQEAAKKKKIGIWSIEGYVTERGYVLDTK
ncbi:thermonuclease [Granulicatella sp. zg-ZJ]|uniref:thermonuclease family protein n=1 Tax=unclassified Granulicatella TaxID=2630493 RepID=UPI0013C0E7F3|nr:MULTISPECIES: thermonuclease family protein [unclassified Granulicatella]MBS4749508.1 thermonuclease family protein [Carnobacteriaceae bacterium zg-ZUI78]NEW62230.1 thermonuclease [Granulicatella sp. zg-ZJ]NEW65700.1 thermonuclease [Granulicatella sp. zg-84]QMI86546.1 thermonuclease family protein [Carnobacteriaceae bacterium zg-84]